MQEKSGGRIRMKKTYFSMISNTILRDKTLSLRSRGLFGLIVSYATIENFDLYKGFLMAQCPEGRKAFDSAWNELKEHGYLIQYRMKDEKNQFYYEYEIVDSPVSQNGTAEKELPGVPFCADAKRADSKRADAKGGNINNTDSSNTLKNNTRVSNNAPRPTLPEIQQYCNENGIQVNPEKFFFYYQSNNWEGVEDWKARLMYWALQNQEKTEKQSKPTTRHTKAPNRFNEGCSSRHYDFDALEKILLSKQ